MIQSRLCFGVNVCATGDTIPDLCENTEAWLKGKLRSDNEYNKHADLPIETTYFERGDTRTIQCKLITGTKFLFIVEPTNA